MSSGGIIIRLIDVAMIILFGFIAISDIKVRAQIKLPSSEEQEEQTPKEDKEPVLVFVRIDPQLGFVIEENEMVIASTQDLTELENLLTGRMQGAQLRGLEMVVLVEPNEDSIIQYTVDVLDICERNNIPKNINYESLQF